MDDSDDSYLNDSFFDDAIRFDPSPSARLDLPANLSRIFSAEAIAIVKKEKATAAWKKFQKLRTIKGKSKHRPRISFGCSSLDNLTGKVEIWDRGITELYGEPGSGKTQLCLQLAVSCVKMNFNCAIINTEKTFPITRLTEMIRSIPGRDHNRLLNSVWIAEQKSATNITEFLLRDFKLVLNHKKVVLLIIDSVAGLFRSLSGDLKHRAQMMRDFHRILMQLQEEHPFAIVCTNQVGGNIDAIPLLGEPAIKPCLGPIWTEFVQNRFQVSKQQRMSPDSIPIRSLRVELSPNIRTGSEAHFIVTKPGLQDLPIDEVLTTETPTPPVLKHV